MCVAVLMVRGVSVLLFSFINLVKASLGDFEELEYFCFHAFCEDLKGNTLINSPSS